MIRHQTELQNAHLLMDSPNDINLFDQFLSQLRALHPCLLWVIIRNYQLPQQWLPAWHHQCHMIDPGPFPCRPRLLPFPCVIFSGHLSDISLSSIVPPKRRLFTSSISGQYHCPLFFTLYVFGWIGLFFWGIYYYSD